MIGPVAKSLIKLNAWLTFLLVVVCIIGIHNTRTRLDDLSRRAQKNDALRIVTAVMTNPDFATYSAAQKDAMVQEIVVAIAKDLKPLFLNVTATFFLGNSDGTLPAFFDNIFAFTFQEMGANVEKNSGIIAATMRKYKASCSTTRECLIEGTLECPNGGSVWCSAPGEHVKCDSCSSWIDPIITGAAITNSVSNLLSARWKDIPNPSTTTPAFSAGVFRLDELFTWAQNQVQVGSWRTAGRTCSGFIQSVEAVPWIGTYFDSNGNPQSWDVRSQVHSVTEVAAKVCSALSQLS